MLRLRDPAGQASVELVALLPLLVLLGLALWQGALAGQAAWASGTAARAAARAAALGHDARAAAGATLPPALRHGLHVAERDGGVVVRVAVPRVLGHGASLGAVSASASFPAQ